MIIMIMIDDDEGDDYDGDDDYDDDDEEKEDEDVRKGNPTNRVDSNTFICNLLWNFCHELFLWFIISQQFTF